jgi:steroid 5-alpha reductase family enzyme
VSLSSIVLTGWVCIAAVMAVLWLLQLHWWAYALLAIGSLLWWIPPLGVLAMLWFLMKVTEIPPTEARAVRSRGEASRDDQRTTSAFFPWPPSAGPAQGGVR